MEHISWPIKRTLGSSGSKILTHASGRRLPPIDSELAAIMYVDELLAGDGSILHIDSMGSVSAMSRAEEAYALRTQK